MGIADVDAMLSAMPATAFLEWVAFMSFDSETANEPDAKAAALASNVIRRRRNAR